MIKIKSTWFILLAALFMSSYVQAEEIIPQTRIANSLTQVEVFQRPFQVVIGRSGQLAIKPEAVFSEGTQDPELVLPELLTDSKSIVLPRSVLDQKWEGEVVLAVAVKIDGTVGEMMVMKSSGQEALDQWATEMVQNWQFRPAMRKGQAVYECIQIPILFELERD